MKAMRWRQVLVLGIVASGGMANLAAGQYAVPPVGTHTDTNPYAADPYVHGFYYAVPFIAPSPYWYGVGPGGYNRAPYNYGVDPYTYGSTPLCGTTGSSAPAQAAAEVRPCPRTPLVLHRSSG